MKLLTKISLMFCLFFLLLTVSSSIVEANNTIINLPGNFPGVNAGVVQGTGAQGVVSTTRQVFFQLRRLLGPVLIILMGSFGIRLLLTGGNEEKFTAVANQFFYLLVGVGFVFVADFMSQTFFLYSAETQTSFVSSEQELTTAARRFTDQVRLVIVFIRYVLGGIALFYTIKSGAVIIFNADEETVTKQKEVFTYGFVGLVLIMVSEAVVNAVFNIQTLPPVPGTGTFTQASVDVGGGISLITNVTNLLLAIMGGMFLFTLVVGGAMYAFSAGNEERGQRATKVIIGSLLGLAIAFSSYTIVAEFSSGGRALDTVNTQTTPLFQDVPGTAPAPAGGGGS